MYFDDLNSLLTMSGHGLYVWSAYGLGLLVLGWNLLAPGLRKKAVEKEIRRGLRRERQS